MMYGTHTYGSVEYGGLHTHTEVVVVGATTPFPATLMVLDKKPVATINNVKPNSNINKIKPTL